MHYYLSLDAADDGTFALDCSTRIHSLAWRLGCESPDQSAAEAGIAEIHLDNADGAFSPERSPTVHAGLWLRLQADDGLTTHTLFTGVIERIVPLPGAHGERTAVITARTPDAALESLAVHLPQSLNLRADQLLLQLFERLPLRRPALASLWVLGDSPLSQLDSARLADHLPISAAFETGISSFAFTAFDARASARDIATQIAAAERGRLIANRQGGLAFYNRHAPLRAATPAAAFDDDMSGLEYAHHPAVNHVRVTITPREIGAPGTPLWISAAALRVPPGLRSIVARYRLENGGDVGVLALEGLTFSASTDPDGAGDPVPIQAVFAPQGADAAVIEFRNPTSRPAYILSGATLRGTPLIAAAPLSVEAADQPGIAHHGFHGRHLVLPLIDSPDEAAQIASFELHHSGEIRETIRWLECDLQAHPAAIALEPLMQISIRESQTGHHRAYWIIGESHQVHTAGSRHHIRFYLAPAAP
ncbi:MAG: hypothetical protein IAE89_12060, partial [Anaerolineae bacterium]|nr:hypothetical protein [Anaerolineae bacterium]